MTKATATDDTPDRVFGWRWFHLPKVIPGALFLLMYRWVAGTPFAQFRYLFLSWGIGLLLAALTNKLIAIARGFKASALFFDESGFIDPTISTKRIPRESVSAIELPQPGWTRRLKIRLADGSHWPEPTFGDKLARRLLNDDDEKWHSRHIVLLSGWVIRADMQQVGSEMRALRDERLRQQRR